MNKDNARWYHLEPVDAWYFRDGRPSNMGEDQSDLKSQFPPNASTVVGAIRAALARENGWNGRSDWSSELKTVLGDGFDDLGKLSFAGPFVTKNEVLLFPMPGHVVGKVGKDKEGSTVFTPGGWLEPSSEPVICDMGKVHLPIWMGEPEEGEKPFSPADKFYVSTTGFSKILNGELPLSEECFHSSQLFSMESRVGISRDKDTRSNIEGSIYSPSFIRLREGVALTVGISGLSEGWDLPAYFPLGGEARLSSCKSIKQPIFPFHHSKDENTVLILATPACFAGNNWWGAGPGETAERLDPEISGTVKTVTFSRPMRIGGWNSRAGKSLAMRPFLKPGTVWWLENNNSITISENEVRQIGENTVYGNGVAFVGKQPISERITDREVM